MAGAIRRPASSRRPSSTTFRLGVPGLPFGGIGESGTGAYHGKWGFDELRHRKSVFKRLTSLDSPVTYPPIGTLRKIIRAFL